MSRTTNRLGQLERLARIKADRELRRYSAFRAQADAMRQHVDGFRDDLAQAVSVPGSDAPSQWQFAVALVGYRADQLPRAEQELDRLRPGLDAARAAATTAFGRAEALAQLRRMTLQKDRQDRQRREIQPP